MRIGNPTEAEARGIAIVHQDQPLVAQFDVTRNVFLGCEPTGFAGLLDLGKMRQVTIALLSKVGATFGPNSLIRDLSVAQREQVAIAGALLRNPRLLILDEPTASLSSAEVEHLFGILRGLRAQGVTIIYISHYIPEVFRLVDRISVFRDGKLVRTMAAAETSPTEVIHLMVGREFATFLPEAGDCARRTDLGDLQPVSGRPGARGQFDSAKGRDSRYRPIRGSRPHRIGAGLDRRAGARWRRSFAGRARIGGPNTPRAAKRQGFALIPEDRRSEGLVDRHVGTREPDPAEYCALVEVGKSWTCARSAQARANWLSGCMSTPRTCRDWREICRAGNQQKVVIGRWLTGDAKVFIFDQPTTGVDVGSRIEIYRQMTILAQQGAAIILISSDFEELLGMSDRIAVMYKGRVNQTLDGQ